MRGLLSDISEKVRALDDADRRANPHKFTGPMSEILYVENVACILGCDVEQVRQISATELPVYSLGDRAIYLRENIVRFLRRQSEETPVQLVASSDEINANGRARRMIAVGPECRKAARSLIPNSRAGNTARGGRFRQADVVRAIRAAKAAGIHEFDVVISPDGLPVVHVTATASDQVAPDIDAEIKRWADDA